MTDDKSNGLTTVIEMLKDLGAESRRSSDRLDRLEAKVEGLAEGLAGLAGLATSTSERLDRLEASMQRMAEVVMNGFQRANERMDRMERAIDDIRHTLRVNLGALRGALDDDDSRIKRLEEQQAETERRLEKLEKKSA